jgi:hypothetical protein
MAIECQPDGSGKHEPLLVLISTQRVQQTMDWLSQESARKAVGLE